MSDICKRLNSISSVELFECIFSPVFSDKDRPYAFLDIYPISSQIREAVSKSGKVKDKMKGIKVDEDILSKIFLTNVLIDDLETYILKSVEHISGYRIEWQKCVNGLTKTTPVVNNLGIPVSPKQWKLYLNFGWLHKNFLEPQFYVDILQNLKYKTQYNDGDNYILVVGEKDPKSTIIDAYDDLSNKQNNYTEKQNDKRNKLASEGRLVAASSISLIPPGFSKRENYLMNSFYATLDGTNLAYLFLMQEIDTNRSFSMDLHETYQFFGISATRNLILIRLINIFEMANLWIDPRSYILLADYMCFTGTPIKVGYFGSEERGDDIMMIATSGQPAKVLTTAALFGGDASPHTSIGMVLTGQITKLGVPEDKPIVIEEEISPAETMLDIDSDAIISAIDDILELEDINMDVDVSDQLLTSDSTIGQDLVSAENNAIIDLLPAPSTSFDDIIIGERMREPIAKSGIEFTLCPVKPEPDNFIVETLNEDNVIIGREILTLDQVL